MPAATVALHMRDLREAGRKEAGLFTQGGRGRSAAQMTSMDAANLLIAAAASQNAASGLGGSVATVNEHSRLWTKQEGSAVWNKIIVSLPQKHTFTEALAILIASSAINRLQQIADETVKGEIDFTKRSTKFDISIVMTVPTVTASIGLQYNDKETEIYHYHFRNSATGWKKHNDWPPSLMKHPDGFGDFGRQVTFSHRTIDRLGTLLGRWKVKA